MSPSCNSGTTRTIQVYTNRGGGKYMVVNDEDTDMYTIACFQAHGGLKVLSRFPQYSTEQEARADLACDQRSEGTWTEVTP